MKKLEGALKYLQALDIQSSTSILQDAIAITYGSYTQSDATRGVKGNTCVQVFGQSKGNVLTQIFSNVDIHNKKVVYDSKITVFGAENSTRVVRRVINFRIHLCCTVLSMK